MFVVRMLLYDNVVELGSKPGQRHGTGEGYGVGLICEIEADVAKTMYAGKPGHPAGSGGMVHFKSWRRLEICPAGNDGNGSSRYFWWPRHDGTKKRALRRIACRAGGARANKKPRRVQQPGSRAWRVQLRRLKVDLSRVG